MLMLNSSGVVVIVVVIGAKERQEIGSSHGVPFNLPADDQDFQWMISIGDDLFLVDFHENFSR